MKFFVVLLLILLVVCTVVGITLTRSCIDILTPGSIPETWETWWATAWLTFVFAASSARYNSNK